MRTEKNLITKLEKSLKKLNDREKFTSDLYNYIYIQEVFKIKEQETI